MDNTELSPSPVPSAINDIDVFIVGAGPVGLTLANELARRKVRVRIIEKLPSIREVSKALILHVRTQEVLDKVGIMAGAQAEAQPLREVVVHGYGKHIGSWHLDGITGRHQHPLIIGQNRTQHLLSDLLNQRGVQVEWNTEALQLALDDSGAILTLRHTDPSATQPKEETLAMWSAAKAQRAWCERRWGSLLKANAIAANNSFKPTASLSGTCPAATPISSLPRMDT